MPDTISPVTREEDYLAAIAGQDVTPPTPATRLEEWLDLIADNVSGLAGDIEDLQDVAPTPEAADEGKVLTAGDDGTASWQTAGGGLPDTSLASENDTLVLLDDGDGLVPQWMPFPPVYCRRTVKSSNITLAANGTTIPAGGVVTSSLSGAADAAAIPDDWDADEDSISFTILVNNDPVTPGLVLAPQSGIARVISDEFRSHSEASLIMTNNSAAGITLSAAITGKVVYFYNAITNPSGGGPK